MSEAVRAMVIGAVGLSTRALALVLMLLLQPGARAQASPDADTRPGVPVVEGSPAWQALMALPAEREGLPTFWAADLLVAWGRGADAARLRRSLLGRHLEAQAAPPPPSATLGQLWQAPVSGHSELVASQQRAQERVQKGAQQQAGAPWALEPPRDDGAVQRLAERIGNRPPADLADFVRRFSGCVAQGTCPERAAWLAERAASAAESRAAAQQREAAFEARQRSAQRRGEWRQQAVLLAWLLGGLLLHLLVARALGRWAGIAATLLLGLGLAVWLVVATGPLSGWGGLGLVILAAGLGGSGLLLAPLYDWIHRRWFARR